MRQNNGMVTEMNERELQNVNGGFIWFLVPAVFALLGAGAGAAAGLSGKKSK